METNKRKKKREGSTGVQQQTRNSASRLPASPPGDATHPRKEEENDGQIEKLC
jgi:hypothetical protein